MLLLPQQAERSSCDGSGSSGQDVAECAGAVVKERTVVPPGTMMVGVPAKCVRELGPEQLSLLDGTPPYVALSKAYLDGHSVLEQSSIDRQKRNMEEQDGSIT